MSVTKSYLNFILLIICSLVSFGQKAIEYPELIPDTSRYQKLGQELIYPFGYLEEYEDERTKKWLKEEKKVFSKYMSQKSSYTKIWSSFAEDLYSIDSYLYRKPVKRPRPKFDSIYSFSIDPRYGEQVLQYRRKKGKRIPSPRLDFVSSRSLLRGSHGFVSIFSYRVSPNNQYVAFNVKDSKEDFFHIFVYDIKKRKQVDHLDHCSPNSVIWFENGFFYNALGRPEQGEDWHRTKGVSIKYHVPGTNQLNDSIVFSNPDSTDRKVFRYRQLNNYYKILLDYSVEKSGQWYKKWAMVDLSKGKFEPYVFLDLKDKGKLYVDYLKNHAKDTLLITSNYLKNGGDIFLVNTKDINKVKRLTPKNDAILTDAKTSKVNIGYDSIQDKKLYLDILLSTFRENGIHHIHVKSFDGQLDYSMSFNEGVSIEGQNVSFYTKKEKDESGNVIAVYKSIRYINCILNSFYQPRQMIKVDIRNNKVSSVLPNKKAFDYSKYHTIYHEYESKDGTLVPMYITKLKEVPLIGNNPAMIYAYGGYGVNIEPHFNPCHFPFLAHGGLLCVPKVRGSGSHGSEWAKAGSGSLKFKGIEDLISAAEYLIDEGISSPEKLVMKGKSHGGFLIASAMAKRSELFKAVIADAGVFDLERADEFTVGHLESNRSEYGFRETPEDFEKVRELSPLSLLKKESKYPSVLLTTGDKDINVAPYNSYMFAAQLQSLPNTGNILLNNIKGATHSITYDWYSQFDYASSINAFLFKELGIKYDRNKLGIYPKDEE